MGYFSWKTQDTDRSISNSASCYGTFRCVMTDNEGHQWVEENYEGFGVFGGKDYYELLAEMNGKETREEGLELAFSKSPDGISEGVLYPSLSENGDYFGGVSPEPCEFQGFFYDDYEDVDDDNDNEY